MPVNQPTGGSDIIGDAASRLKQDRAKRVLGMRDIVQPQGPQDAQSIITRMAGAAKPKTANDPTRGAQFMPNEGKSNSSEVSPWKYGKLPNPVDAAKAYRPNGSDRTEVGTKTVHCRSCGPTTMSLSVKGFPSSFGNRDDQKKPDNPVDAAKPFGKPKDDSTAAKPDAPAKAPTQSGMAACPTCGQQCQVSYSAPAAPAAPPPGAGAMPPPNDATAQPEAPRDVGQGYAAPNFPGHGMPGTQGPGADVTPPPGNSTPPPGQPAIGAVGPAQSILQQVMQLPVEQLDLIKRAIESRMAVVRTPLTPPANLQNPVDASRSNYFTGKQPGEKQLELEDKSLAAVGHFAWKHRDALLALGYVIAKRGAV